MKKRILISIMLIGCIAVFVGFGTFALFSGTATSNFNTFSIGTLGFNPGENKSETFDVGKVINSTDVYKNKPGVAVTGNEVVFTNNGTLDMGNLTADVKWSIKKDGGLVATNDSSLGGANDGTISGINFDSSKFKVRVYMDDYISDWVPIGLLKDTIQNQLNSKVLKSKEYFKLKVDTLLDSSADNGFQNTELTFNISIIGSQV